MTSFVLPFETPVGILRHKVDAIALDGGFPVGGFRLMIGLLLSCGIAPLIHLTRSETSRHLLNVVVGLVLGWFVFEYAVFHTLGSVAVVYLLMQIAPRKSVGKIVLPLMLSYLVGCHYYREYHEPDLVWDCAQMVMTLKLSGLAIGYSDGAIPDEKKTPVQLNVQVKELPSIISFLGYVFFFPTYLAGPPFEYNDYVVWMKQLRRAPILVHARNFGLVVICGIGFALSLQNPVDRLDAQDFYPDNWVKRLFMTCISVSLFRFRFYLAWSIAEAASAVAGVGYVPSTGKWNAITNNDILCVELPTNFRVGINNWNMGVARWLNTYIYQRVGLSKSGKPSGISTFSSFFVSALWHGLAPGYYLFFLLGALYIEVGKEMRRRFRSIFHYTEDRTAYPHSIFLTYFSGKTHPLAFFYDISGLLFSWIAMQYAGIAFEILDVRRCIRIWASWYFIPHIVCVTLLVLFAIFPHRPSVASKKNN